MARTAAKSPPVRRRKPERKGEIIEAGMLEFAEKGFAGARLEDVARRAGVAKGTIYLYFDSKEALFAAAVRSRTAAAIGGITTLVDEFDGSAEDLLRQVIARVYRDLVQSDTNVLMRVIIAEGHRFPDLRNDYYETAIGRGMKTLERVLAYGARRGEFRASPNVDTVRAIVAPAVMSAIWRLTFEDIEPLDVDSQIEAHLDIVLNGLLTGAS